MNYAQTNLQLMNQLVLEGYDRSERGFISDAYRLAMRLFTGWFRPSGKTFIAHVVGTASILTWQRASTTAICTGLLHAAYTHGEFAAGGEPSHASRTHVRSTVGSDVERLVLMYSQLQWNPQTMREFTTPERSSQLTLQQRELLLVRLANELDDHLDLAALYSLGPIDGRAYAETFLPPARILAQRLDLPSLAMELERTLYETRHGTVEHVFGSEKRSTFLPPQTYRLKIELAIARRIGRLKFGRAVLGVYRRAVSSSSASRS